MLQDFGVEFAKCLTGSLLPCCNLIVKRTMGGDGAAQLLELVNVLRQCTIGGDVWLGAGWSKTSVLPRLNVRPNILNNLENLSTIASSWAISAQSSANSASVISFSSVFVFAMRCHRPNSDPSSQSLM